MKNKSLEEIEKSTKSFLSTSEAAVVLGISPSTLRKRADEYSELFPIQRGRKEIQNEKGYGVNMNKYMSIKVKPDSKDIRTYRLGDGYFLEHLNYRIEHKNFEMPLSEIAKYSGIQREYAICLRQIQMILYKLVDCLEKCLIYGHIRRFAD